MSEVPEGLGLSPVTVTDEEGAVTQAGWALYERSGGVVRFMGNVIWDAEPPAAQEDR